MMIRRMFLLIIIGLLFYYYYYFIAVCSFRGSIFFTREGGKKSTKYIVPGTGTVPGTVKVTRGTIILYLVPGTIKV